jgi:CRISPR system Cascade subunit CasD
MPSGSDLPLMDFLVFRLWGAMAAWGDIAVGERRGTWARPSRSGVLGLIAAAMGIERTDTAAHQRLEDGLGFAVRVDDPGRPMRDYHTAQSPSEKRGRRWATRRDELDGGNDLNTILSERIYQLEMNAVVVVWLRPGSQGPGVATIAKALAEPVFAPYLGRKSCPLGLPLMPVGIDAATPVAALALHDALPRPELEFLKAPHKHRQPVRRDIWLDADDARTFGLPVAERTVRRDRVRDRARWLFTDRAEVRIAGEATP